jgi:hypothetical protein
MLRSQDYIVMALKSAGRHPPFAQIPALLTRAQPSQAPLG